MARFVFQLSNRKFNVQQRSMDSADYGMLTTTSRAIQALHDLDISTVLLKETWEKDWRTSATSLQITMMPLIIPTPLLSGITSVPP